MDQESSWQRSEVLGNLENLASLSEVSAFVQSSINLMHSKQTHAFKMRCLQKEWMTAMW